MITDSELEDILNKNETDILDFKSKYRLDNDHFKSKFIKDILAMSNTPRNETAFIIVGVKAHTNGRKELLGVDDHPDDADLQEYLNKVDIVDPVVKTTKAQNYRILAAINRRFLSKVNLSRGAIGQALMRTLQIVKRKITF